MYIDCPNTSVFVVLLLVSLLLFQLPLVRLNLAFSWHVQRNQAAFAWSSSLTYVELMQLSELPDYSSSPSTKFSASFSKTTFPLPSVSLNKLRLQKIYPNPVWDSLTKIIDSCTEFGRWWAMTWRADDEWRAGEVQSQSSEADQLCHGHHVVTRSLFGLCSVPNRSSRPHWQLSAGRLAKPSRPWLVVNLCGVYSRLSSTPRRTITGPGRSACHIRSHVIADLRLRKM